MKSKLSLPKLIIDTSACSRIAKSSHRNEIEAYIDKFFRRVVSVPTFWELLEQFKGGGNKTHFHNDREGIKVAAGTRRPAKMLPHPLAFAVETVLKLKPKPSATNPDELRRLYEVIGKADSLNQLFAGEVRLRGYSRKGFGLDPTVVSEQQEAGETCHVERLKLAQRGLPPPPIDEWAKLLAAENAHLSIDAQQAAKLGASLDAAYRFDVHVWQLAAQPRYDPGNHRNDWIDMQQLIYLCDPTLRLLVFDKGFQKVVGSQQANRLLSLPDFLKSAGISL